jgi:hypothetical protein
MMMVCEDGLGWALRSMLICVSRRVRTRNTADAGTCAAEE